MVSNESDGEGGTNDRNEGAPPERPSAMQLLADPVEYPHDSSLAKTLRLIDRYAGLVQQAALFALLFVIVLVGVVQALATKLFDHSFLWSFGVVRAGTFAIAMLGAAFASHQARHLSMDLVSRKIGPRSRQGLRIAMGTFTIFATMLLLQSGLHLVTTISSEGGAHTVPQDLLAMMIPIGCGLIIFHTFLHLLIDIDYMRRGKLQPERTPSGH